MDQSPALPRRVAWFAPWTWSPRKLALPLLFASWIAAIGARGTMFIIFKESPPSNLALLWVVTPLSIASTLWFIGAPVFAIALALRFIQDDYWSHRKPQPTSVPTVDKADA